MEKKNPLQNLSGRKRNAKRMVQRSELNMTNKPAPLLNPGTLKPMTAEELGTVFCEELVKQELDNDNRYIPIPQKIQDFIKCTVPLPW